MIQDLTPFYVTQFYTFQTVEDLRRALHDWLRLYNEQWLVERHGFRSPA
ncbi:MAG: hypothetical protein OEY77_03310 [Nitrospira sp.]|nr:hypothetical protein [Nitrospira sp.]